MTMSDSGRTWDPVHSDARQDVVQGTSERPGAVPRWGSGFPPSIAHVRHRASRPQHGVRQRHDHRGESFILSCVVDIL